MVIQVLISVLSCLLTQEPEVQPATRPAHPDQPIQVLILGSYHFANPGRDVVKHDVADVMTPNKQEEIAAVVESLAAFRPTRVAVEVEPESQDRLDAAYDAYREGQRELERNEREQIGFRLAKRFGIERVHAIDRQHKFPMDPVAQYAAENDPAALQWMQTKLAEMKDEANRMQRENSVGEMLQLLNKSDWVDAQHGLYLDMMRIGAGKTPAGADLVAAWYERNIRIFHNLQAIAQPGDRVLVVFGAGHAALLRHLVEADPRMELVDALKFLGADDEAHVSEP